MEWAASQDLIQPLRASQSKPCPSPPRGWFSSRRRVRHPDRRSRHASARSSGRGSHPSRLISSIRRAGATAFARAPAGPGSSGRDRRGIDDHYRSRRRCTGGPGADAWRGSGSIACAAGSSAVAGSAWRSSRLAAWAWTQPEPSPQERRGVVGRAPDEAVERSRRRDDREWSLITPSATEALSWGARAARQRPRTAPDRPRSPDVGHQQADAPGRSPFGESEARKRAIAARAVVVVRLQRRVPRSKRFGIVGAHVGERLGAGTQSADGSPWRTRR